MTAQQTSSTCTRSVTFADKANARCMLHINDYTEKQRRAAFYNAKEIRAINVENKETLRKMQKKESIDETQMCTRGLERHLREASKLRKVQQRAAVSAVLAHQFYMLEEGEIDQDMPADESIALVYSSLTGPSTISAYMMGLSDAKAAQEEEDAQQIRQDKKQSSTQQSKTTSCRRMVMMRMKEQNRLSVCRQIANSAA